MPNWVARRIAIDADILFWRRIEFTPTCWLWLGANGPWGHGNFHCKKYSGPAHRFAYQFEHGSVPSHLVIDHMCRNPKCVRPSHLRAVTQRENLASSPLWTGHRTKCKKCGAKLTVWPKASPYKRCRQCNILKLREASRVRRRKLGIPYIGERGPYKTQTAVAHGEST